MEEQLTGCRGMIKPSVESGHILKQEASLPSPEGTREHAVSVEILSSAAQLSL